MTSEDEKTVHQQSITGPLGDHLWQLRNRCCCEPEDFEAIDAVEAEVRRLRVLALDEARAEMIEGARALEGVVYDQSKELARLQAVVADQSLTIGTQKDELGRLRDQNLRVLKSERDALNKLARVEALPAQWRAEYDDNCEACAVDLETALNPILKD